MELVCGVCLVHEYVWYVVARWGVIDVSSEGSHGRRVGAARPTRSS